jgi:hypothetical protein
MEKNADSQAKFGSEENTENWLSVKMLINYTQFFA